jgi:hypothetical protein
MTKEKIFISPPESRSLLAMGRMFRNIVAAVPLLLVAATEGKLVSIPDSNVLISRAPVQLPGNGFSYLGCFT